MQIGEVAAATGLSRDTLRFYEKRGLLRARRSANGYRDYPAEALDWLRYIRIAQQLGFSLAEIEADLPLLSAPDAQAPQLRAALQRPGGGGHERPSPVHPRAVDLVLPTATGTRC